MSHHYMKSDDPKVQAHIDRQERRDRRVEHILRRCLHLLEQAISCIIIIVLMISHYVSLASMVAGVCYPIFTLTSPKVGHLPPFIIFSLVVAVLLIYTHRKNIQRLKEGTENKIYVWKRKQKRCEICKTKFSTSTQTAQTFHERSWRRLWQRRRLVLRKTCLTGAL